MMTNRRSDLEALLAERILLLDGAMGTALQSLKLEEADFRGELFADHPCDLKGNNDLLAMTRPEVVKQIHADYFAAGADIVETNSFSATTIAQADYQLESIVRDLNLACARLATEAAREAEAATPGRQCFVAGTLGPTNRTASMSRDVNDPAARAVTFDELVVAYREQAAALIDGGVDLLLIETIFDTLNAKAAYFGIREEFDARGDELPVMVSVTITDASGRTLSGQTTEAFWNSVAHMKPFSVGLNCALGPEDMRPYLEELSTIADCFVTCHPNAGLPNPLSPTGFDLGPPEVAATLKEFAENGWLNIVGGCCGTTPEFIGKIKEVTTGVAPRPVPEVAPALRLSGLEPLTIG